MLSNISFITLTDSGYINFTLNCLQSLKKIKFDGNLKCYCIGEEGYNILKAKKYECNLINDEENTNFQSFRTGNWANITKYKFDIIYENLLKYKYVCITDGDIVFENNKFLNYCLSNIGDNDLFIQNDSLKEDDNSILCSGFMFIVSNDKTKEIFNPSNLNKYGLKPKDDDQVYINKNKNIIKFKKLPLKLFPNGNYYYNIIRKSKKGEKPYIIHFNWVPADYKMKMIKKYKKWFI